jgi:hypothetical protein
MLSSFATARNCTDTSEPLPFVAGALNCLGDLNAGSSVLDDESEKPPLLAKKETRARWDTPFS